VSAAIDHMNGVFCRAGGFDNAYAGGSTTASRWQTLEPTVALNCRLRALLRMIPSMPSSCRDLLGFYR
jgi:hypothetical protein